MVKLLATAVLVLGVSVVSAVELPPPQSPTDALKQVMKARHAAQARAGTDASPEQLRQSALELGQLLALLDQQPYRDFTRHSKWMFAEYVNISVPLAEIHARLGDRDKALQALDISSRVVLAPPLAESLEAMPAFAAIKDEPRFKAVMDKFRRGGFASTHSLASPYKDVLTMEQRVAGLSLFWSEVRHNFANVDLGPPLNWDAVYLDYLAKVGKAESTADYYKILMRLAPLLQDGHTNIYPPKELADRFYARPPLGTGLVEDKVIVLAVHDDQLRKRIEVGEEILAIDGVPVKEYAEKHVRPYVSSSTEQDRHVRMYSYQLLAGNIASPVQLTLRRAKGSQHTIELERRLGNTISEARFPFRLLPGGIAYLRLDHFESDEGVQAFEKALPQILSSKGLILDVRSNGGGSSSHGQRILSYLTDRPLRNTAGKVRGEQAYERAQRGDHLAWNLLMDDGPIEPHPESDKIFKGPVAVLIGPGTFSAAEDFVAVFGQSKRGALVGEATGGSTGQPLMLDLPGGGLARICVKRDFYADGSDFVGKGIQPTHQSINSVEAIRSGSDPVLAEAQKLLTSSPAQFALKAE